MTLLNLFIRKLPSGLAGKIELQTISILQKGSLLIFTKTEFW